MTQCVWFGHVKAYCIAWYSVTNECQWMQLGVKRRVWSVWPIYISHCQLTRNGQQAFLQYHDPSRRRILVLSPYKLIIKRTVLLLIITGCLQWANPLGQCGIYTSDVTKGDKRRKTFPDISLQLEQTAPAHIIGSLVAAAELISWPRICGAARAINNYITMRGYPGINWKLVPMPIWDPDNLQCLDAGFGWRRSRVEKQSPHQNTVVG